MKMVDDQFNKLTLKMASNLDHNDGKKIWNHFQRFAEYSDLKDLYNKCIPKLVKYEQVMEDFEANYTKLHDVIKRFDICLTQKASKIQLDELETRWLEEFVRHEDQTKFTDKVEQTMSEQASAANVRH